MAFTISNTLSGDKETLEPVRAGEVSLYVCGPTVYDDPHIGHLRSAYVFDMARRVLKESYPQAEVKFVRNVTDIDDKIIERAVQEKISVSEVAEKYLKSYHSALERLGIEPPTEEPKATQYIEQMIQFIKALIAKDSAYVANGNVYFRVKSFGGYGKLSRQKIDEIYNNVRVDPGEGKQDDLDFALWKKSAPGEPSWASDWGPGRPGWHIECSVMSTQRLGDAFDIHGGGRDLLFPHHENERAQSMALDKSFARIWMHHGILTIEGKKMSKSLGNFVNLDEILKRGHSLDALKLLFLQSHYRSDMDFTWDKLRSCQTALVSFAVYLRKAEGVGKTEESYEEAFAGAMRDDFDTPRALSVLFGALNSGNSFLGSERSRACGIATWIEQKFQNVFNISLLRQEWEKLLASVVQLRMSVRKEGRYDLSDLIRSELVLLGFKVEDGKKGSIIVPTGQMMGSDDLEIRLANLRERVEKSRKN